MTAPTRPIFVLDTNVLIDLNFWLPISLHGFFWAKFQESLARGEWVLLDVVVNEVRYGEIKKWCVDQKRAGSVRSITDDNRNRAVEINDMYKMIDDVTGNSTVDPYIVAYAEANKITIFTREGPRMDDTKLYKIPDVCDKLGISYTRVPKDFLDAIGFKN
jgi:predicted nucleic acid-binding protein